MKGNFEGIILNGDYKQINELLVGNLGQIKSLTTKCSVLNKYIMDSL